FAPNAAWRHLDDREEVTNRVGERGRVPVWPPLAQQGAELRKRAGLLDHGPSCLGEHGPHLQPDQVATEGRRTQRALEHGLEQRAQVEAVAGGDEVDGVAHDPKPNRAEVYA